jgi:large subunit ribosomal protein L15
MQLHTLSQVVKRSKKRLGQGHGSGRGKTSGRGTKGQKARTDIPLRFEGGAVPLVKRMPFLRGKQRNKPFTLKPLVINLEDLVRMPAKTIVDIAALTRYGLISEDVKSNGVKLLGRGEVKNAYTIKILVSKAAAEKIIKAGGSVEAIV